MLTDVNYYLIVIDLSYVTVWLMWIKINEMKWNGNEMLHNWSNSRNKMEEHGAHVPLLCTPLSSGVGSGLQRTPPATNSPYQGYQSDMLPGTKK
jgi:hypothetical protein